MTDHHFPRENAAQHGSRSMYNLGCRCRPCTDAATAYTARWRDKRRATNRYRLLNGRWLATSPPNNQTQPKDNTT